MDNSRSGLSCPKHKLRLFFCDHYGFSLPPGHKFPLSKYEKLRAELSRDDSFHLVPANPAEPQDILRVHSADYVQGFLTGTLPAELMRRIGFPWSKELVNRTLASVGGTLQATAHALAVGFSGTLAGGTHHAYRTQGSGFCVFNDMAIAVEWARAYRGVRRALIIDLDVHQGDGTAAIFQGDPDVFTLSLHGDRNFPFRKQQSVVDVPLDDGTGDGAYLEALRRALQQARAFRPEIVFFQSGVDALETDTLGRLSLTLEGLALREALVYEFVSELNVPLVQTLGGGYSDPIELTVAAHAQSFRIAARHFSS
ncbi:MAG: histone deacetylase [Bryobacteraceae bacterium]